MGAIWLNNNYDLEAYICSVITKSLPNLCDWAGNHTLTYRPWVGRQLSIMAKLKKNSKTCKLVDFDFHCKCLLHNFSAKIVPESACKLIQLRLLRFHVSSTGILDLLLCVFCITKNIFESETLRQYLGVLR